jgi:hypothetical protein
MKTRTILKAIGYFIGWIVSFQLIDVGTHLMNQPSSVSFTTGVLLTIFIIGTIFLCAHNFAQNVSKLVQENREKKIKQDKQEEL